MYIPRPTKTFFSILIACLILAMACSETAPVVDDENGDRPNEQEPVEQNNVNNDDDDRFLKPESNTSSNNARFMNADDDDVTSLTAPNFLTHNWGREHMRGTYGLAESWLYEGEFFVRDGHFTGAFPAQGWTEGPVHIFALYDGDLLPFRFIEIEHEDDYPTIEEIESWNEDQFTTRDTITVETKQPINYTIAIPPWAFPEKGAYQFHLFFLPDYQANDSPGAHARSWFSMPRTKHTVYYGSHEYPAADASLQPQHQSNRHGFRSSYDDVGPSTQERIRQLLNLGLRGLFLTPPKGFESTWVDAIRVGSSDLLQLFETTEPEVTLDLHFSDYSYVRGDGRTSIGDETLIYVLQDLEILDVFWLYPRQLDGSSPILDTLPDHPDWQADKVGIDIDLPPNKETTVQVIAAPHPYDGDTDPRDFRTTVESNAIILRYTPENTKDGY